ncbi:SigE family RNA polymerase sigma factor [Catellatospora sp. KI3]|uniref:SigE family RNA polymerase sigma factor n=1 Tax=Catellatospora sp. KI3 TaxID=3041620 RepID=UPI0024824221|nr:SigE family RNA polymerase sigma factor [Catellatospora sp. KI3]MDI1459628.1 SigE family RNA polymerase sigma factor [Catellatospora sp. KI3]
MAKDADGFREFAAGRLDAWRRTAYLLCGDWHAADDMVSAALTGLYRHWDRVSRMEHPDAYVRTSMLRAMLNERRRPWRRERPVEFLPERVATGPGPDGVDQHLDVTALLAELPARRRAVLVLRFFCDLSVEETAAELGCSTGTVKSQTFRALEALRARLQGTGLVAEEA